MTRNAIYTKEMVDDKDIFNSILFSQLFLVNDISSVMTNNAK